MKRSKEDAYVLMVQMPQKLDFPKRPLRVHVIIEGVRDLLDRNHLPGLRIHHRASKNSKEVVTIDPLQLHKLHPSKP